MRRFNFQSKQSSKQPLNLVIIASISYENRRLNVISFYQLGVGQHKWLRMYLWIEVAASYSVYDKKIYMYLTYNYFL